MASTILDPVAEALKDAADALSGVTAHKWVLRDTDSRPAAVVELPTVTRTQPDAEEDHLGEYDWRSDWTVAFYFDFDPQAPEAYGQVQALEVIEAWIQAVNANPTLGGAVQEAKVVTAGPPELNDELSRPLIAYPTQVAVFDFSST